jgi:transcriptional regulator with XRE-family HTH domain
MMAAIFTSEVVEPRPVTPNVVRMTQAHTSVGDLVRRWRKQRGLSQLHLAVEAGVSPKHVSFIESGRAAPSRGMVLQLAEHLDVPLRERNAMLLAAGFAPIFRDRPLTDPALARAMATIERLLRAHEPYPALTVDRHWTLISANDAVPRLLAGVDPELMKPPVNVLRMSLHPRGLAPLIVNLAEWRSHLLERLRRQIRITGDRTLDALLRELTAYPGSPAHCGNHASPAAADDVAVPFKLRTHGGVLSFLSTITVFGTPVEITLSELSLEAFYPADPETAAALSGRGVRQSP